MTKKPLNSILIKPAGPDCNLSCQYCFYLKKSSVFGQSSTHRMSTEILEKTIQQSMTKEMTQISFGWQGGEPSLMGLPFFEKAIEFQKVYGRGQFVGNGLQTNGLLIDRNWARFLKSFKFLVGLSLDGPEHIHNRYRLNKGGEGSWLKVVNTAKLLMDSGVSVNTLTVVNNYSVSFPTEIYQFHKELGFDHMQFIPCLELNSNDPTQSAPFSVSAEKFGQFLCAIFDLWKADFKQDRPTTSIRYFDSLLQGYMQLGAGECTMQHQCGDYLVVEHNGDVFSCDFFVDSKWRLGNVKSHRLIDMLNSTKQRQFGCQKSRLAKECKVCPWLTSCYGGCIKDRLNNPENQNHNAFCNAYQVFFEHSDSDLRSLAQKWMSRPAFQKTPLSVADSTGSKTVGRNKPCPCGSGYKYKKCCGK